MVMPLRLAIELGQHRVAKLLVEKGADVHCKRPSDGATAMFLCACFADAGVIKVVAAAGGDVEAATKDGTTPIAAGELGAHLPTTTPP
jgi:ankyrin repeat protein